MSNTIWVKVVGFNQTERHTLNTLFRVSVPEDTHYGLWTPECSVVPHVVLIDMDCHEAEVELASPTFNPNVSVISVGDKGYPGAWRSFPRPVDWLALIAALNGLFVAATDDYVDTRPGEVVDKGVPPGVRVTLVVGLVPEDRLYLRARLALAGLTDVDEASTAEQASGCMAHRHYDVVFVSLELEDADPWSLVQTLQGLMAPPQAVVVVTSQPSWAAMEQADRMGCAGLLECPFNPPQVISLLHKV